MCPLEVQGRERGAICNERDARSGDRWAKIANETNTRGAESYTEGHRRGSSFARPIEVVSTRASNANHTRCYLHHP